LTTSTYPSSTFHFGVSPLAVRQAVRLVPSNRTTASDGGLVAGTPE